jgi:hypothetical protein
VAADVKKQATETATGFEKRDQVGFSIHHSALSTAENQLATKEY